MDIILCYPKFLWEGNKLKVDPMKLHEDKRPKGKHIYIGNLSVFWGNLIILGKRGTLTLHHFEIFMEGSSHHSREEGNLHFLPGDSRFTIHALEDSSIISCTHGVVLIKYLSQETYPYLTRSSIVPYPNSVAAITILVPG